MLVLKSILLFSLPYLICGKYVNTEKKKPRRLRWPSVYTVEATKLYLSSGWVENLKYWSSTDFARLDANGGAVIKIRPQIQKDYGYEYEIHPETTEEETNEMKCYDRYGSEDEKIEEIRILPDAHDFEVAGNDNVKGVDCVKFNGKYEGETLWAYYDKNRRSWIPVRFEELSKNLDHGYISDHVIYDFFKFETEVDETVFDVYKDYHCEVSYNNDDDAKLNSSPDLLESMKPEENEIFEQEFAKYKQRFNKKYAHHSEHEMRKRIFHKSWRLVRDTNEQNVGYKLGFNKMSDRTKKEMNRYKGLRRDTPRAAGNIRFPYALEDIIKISDSLPLEYDLRLEGVVGPVLSQEDCGSCWSFGTTAAMEGALARSNGGMLIALSNQALVDCSWGFGNGGCNGGSDTAAFKWIMKYGMPTQAEYGPYATEDGYCNIENMTTTYKIRGWVDVTPFSEQALKIALINHGPLSVSIDATDALANYEGGILYDITCNATNLNHEVALVGYGNKDGESFWIIKNSWGPHWGIDGYMHISTRDNNCGVMTEPTYVVI